MSTIDMAADWVRAGDPAWTGTREPGRVRARASADAEALAWATVPQLWHSPHRPAHFLLCQPHSEHWYSVATADFPMTCTVAAGADTRVVLAGPPPVSA
jgi:hypothetical protein